MLQSVSQMRSGHNVLSLETGTQVVTRMLVLGLQVSMPWVPWMTLIRPGRAEANLQSIVYLEVSRFASCCCWFQQG
jgi:hypothetical protein